MLMFTAVGLLTIVPDVALADTNIDPATSIATVKISRLRQKIIELLEGCFVSVECVAMFAMPATGFLALRQLHR